MDRRSGRVAEVAASAMTLKSWKTVDLAGENGGGKEIVFDLEGPSTDGIRDARAWQVRLHVAMKADDWFLRKWLEISRTTADSVAVDRIDLEAAIEVGDLERAEGILTEDCELPDVREGETILTDLWFAMHESRIADAENTVIDDALRRRVREEYPPPANLDFRVVPS